MTGGIRFVVCCDDCGVDATDVESYSTEGAAIKAREWASREGGWLWRRPNKPDQSFVCPECAANPSD